jgi:tRNA A-37 threonylcarbamoyl transferase component Bud32
MLVAGRYRVRELVGSGGMGSVWRAADELLGREVAIKQVRLDLQPPGDVPLARERTMREARIAAALHHPNVVTIFDVVTDGGAPWLVLEYLPSRSLGSILAEQGALHPAHVAQIGAQVAAALGAAHAAGIVHRDVKPDNILVARPPGIGQSVGWPGTVVKLTDFGISHAAASPALTSTGVLTGTPAYFAPETARGEGTDARSDVYSLGATLYAAVEGRPPYEAGEDNVLALLGRIGQGGPRPPQRAGPLTELLRHLVADDPAVRPTAEQARYALQAIAQWQHGYNPRQYAPTIDNRAPVPTGPAPGYGPRSGAMAAPVPAPAAPAPRSRWGVPLAVLSVLVVAAVIAGISVIALNATSPGRPSASPQASGAPATSALPSPTPAATSAPPVPGGTLTIGDPHTADPCSLVNPGLLNTFGSAAIDRENSEFSACRADLTLASGASVTYLVDFLSPPEVTSAEPESTYEQVAGLTVVRQPGQPDGCERRLLFPDGNVVDIQAVLYDEGVADLCAIADAGTSFALETIRQSGVGTREPLETTSALAAVDACSLLTSGELALVPGADTAPAEAEFGSWGCIWNPPTSDQLVRMDFYRGYPLYEEVDGPATVYAGKPGAYRYEPGRYCLAQIVQRDFTVTDGTLRSDVVRIFAFGPGSEDVQCRYATELAGIVAPKLPPG